MSVDISVLGGFSVRVDGEPVVDGAWRRRAASAVVKLLALTDGRALHREQVVDTLWPELSPTAALPRLHQAAHYARGALRRRDGVVLRRDRVLLLPDTAVSVDALEFRRRAEDALATGDPAVARRVLAGHGDEVLPEDLYAEWTAPHRAAHAALRDRLRGLAGGGADLVRTGLVGHHARGRSKSLLLVVDDLTAADPASLRLLHHVAASITARGLGRVLELG